MAVRKLPVRLFALLACSIFAVSCSSLVERQLKIQIPNADWPKIVFRAIDTVTELSALKQLRESHLNAGDAEFRIWRGFGTSPRLEGVILKRTAGAWTATYVVTDDYNKIVRTDVRPLPIPKSGWDGLWVKLDAAGLKTLPDSSDAGCAETGADGVAYIIELNENDLYRAYLYQSNFSKCPQVEQVKQIGRTIAEEFDDGKQECKKAEWLACEARPAPTPTPSKKNK